MNDDLRKESDCDLNCASCSTGCEDDAFDQPTVVLTLDDDTELTCAIVTIFPVEDREYIALLPLGEDGENHDGEVFLYRYLEYEGGQPRLENIADDEEYHLAANAFDALVEEGGDTFDDGADL